jgi:flagellar biosynthesis chaperone FliJ
MTQWTVDYKGQVPAVIAAVQTTIGKIDANTALIEAKKNEMAGWANGQTLIGTALPQWRALEQALNQHKTELMQLKAQINTWNDQFAHLDTGVGPSLFA